MAKYKLKRIIVRSLDDAMGYYRSDDSIGILGILHPDDTFTDRWKERWPDADRLLVRAIDADPERYLYEGEEDQVLTVEQAREIAVFAMRIRDTRETLLVHCAGGYSRGPGAALAIWDAFDLRMIELPNGAEPNRHIFNLIHEALFRQLAARRG